MSLTNWLGLVMATLGIGAMWWHGVREIGWRATAVVWLSVLGLVAFMTLTIWLITY